MPTTIYFPKDAKHSGIDITWTPSAGCLDIGGWYDSMNETVLGWTRIRVGIQSSSMTLTEFFHKLGITKQDVLKALPEI